MSDSLRYLLLVILCVLAGFIPWVAFGENLNERWAPAVRDRTVCGKGVVSFLGLNADAKVDVGVPTLPEDVVEILVSDETLPLSDILGELFWQNVDAPGGADAPLVYGPIHQNIGKTKCLVEAADA